MLRNVRAAASTYGIRFHYTLTVPGRITRSEQKSLLDKARKSLFSNLGKLRTQGLAYVWAIGSGDCSGRLHIHLLTNLDLWKRIKHRKLKAWLKPQWRKWTGGGHAKHTEIDSPHRVAAYFAKAVFETVEWGRLGSAKLYSASRNVMLRERHRSNDDSVWQTVNLPSAKLAERYGIETGYPVNTTFEIPSENDAAASTKTPQGAGVLCGRGAEGAPPVPATQGPGGAPTGSKKEGAE